MFKFVKCFFRKTIYSTHKRTTAFHLNDMLIYHIAITTSNYCGLLIYAQLELLQTPSENEREYNTEQTKHVLISFFSLAVCP